MEEILKLDNQLCFRLYSVSRKMIRAYQPLLEKYNLTYPQYIIMLILFEHEKLDFNELSKIVDLKTGTLTPLINNMVKIGYIQKVKNHEDKRRVFVELTDLGKNLKTEIIDVPLGLASQLEITEEMYNVLVKELDQLSSILNKAKKV